MVGAAAEMTVYYLKPAAGLRGKWRWRIVWKARENGPKHPRWRGLLVKGEMGWNLQQVLTMRE
jgi:hypothetical protein